MKKLSKTAIICLFLLAVLSMWTIHTISVNVEIENKILDMVFTLFIFFGVGFIYANAFTPIILFIERIFKN